MHCLAPHGEALMSWLPVILIAAAAFSFAVVATRLPRAGWALFGAALLFGLAGYGVQGSPDQAGAPSSAATATARISVGAIEARRSLFDANLPPSRFVTIADAFFRRGQFADAANMLRNAVQERPDDTEAWVALGNALLEHAGGRLTPAAEYAYRRARQIDPEHPAAGYFLGIAQLRSGDPRAARETWRALLERAPEDAAWRAQLEQRLFVLGELIEYSQRR